MTGATRIEAHHQDHRQIASLRARHPDPTTEIDPRLAEQLGIREGDWLRITTPAGTLRQRAHFIPGLGLDRISAERWWYPERPLSEPSLGGFWESNVNAYVRDDLDACDPAYGAWPFRVARCNVERDHDNTVSDSCQAQSNSQNGRESRAQNAGCSPETAGVHHRARA
jgi:anaerobic selenocysteine-containing dehydrogenase